MADAEEQQKQQQQDDLNDYPAEDDYPEDGDYPAEEGTDIQAQSEGHDSIAATGAADTGDYPAQLDPAQASAEEPAQLTDQQVDAATAPSTHVEHHDMPADGSEHASERQFDHDDRSVSRSSQHAEGSTSNTRRNLHVSMLNYATTEEALQELFGQYGELDSVTITRDPHSKASRGFGFVKFTHPEDAEAAIKGLDGHVLDNKAIKVQEARRDKPYEKTPGTYMGSKRGGGRYAAGPRRFRDRSPPGQRLPRRRSVERTRGRDHYDRRPAYDAREPLPPRERSFSRERYPRDPVPSPPRHRYDRRDYDRVPRDAPVDRYDPYYAPPPRYERDYPRDIPAPRDYPPAPRDRYERPAYGRAPPAPRGYDDRRAPVREEPYSRRAPPPRDDPYMRRSPAPRDSRGYAADLPPRYEAYPSARESRPPVMERLGGGRPAGPYDDAPLPPRDSRRYR